MTTKIPTDISAASSPRESRQGPAPSMAQRKFLAAMLPVIALVAWVRPALAQTECGGMQDLGTLGGTGSQANAVSADGSVVVGHYYNAAGQQRAFRWTAVGGMQDLGSLPGAASSLAYGVSADGSVVVGSAAYLGGAYYLPFHWSASGGMRNLWGNYAEAFGISAGGDVEVGKAYSGTGYYTAARWTAGGGISYMGTFGGNSSFAAGVSADGAVVVGGAQNAAGYYRAFRWTSTGGMQNMGTLPIGTESWAFSVSADGSVVVGRASNAAGASRAFRWTTAGGMQDLGTLGGTRGEAYGVSADGAVVVGLAYNAAGNSHGFRWTAAGGMQDLGTLGGNRSAAYGASADGAVVVGYSNTISGTPHAFRWRRGATIWMSPVDGNFDDPTKWCANTIPLATHDVVVDRPGTYTVTLRQSHTVHSIRVAPGVHVTFAGEYTLAASGDVQIDGHVTLLGSTLTAGGYLTVNQGGALTLQPASPSSNSPLPRVSCQASGLDINGTLEGAGDVDGNVRIRGTLHPIQGDLDTVSRALIIHDDLTYIDGTPMPIHKVDLLNAFPWTAKVYVEGTARLGGKIQIVSRPGITPAIGQRITIIDEVPFSGGQFDASARFVAQEGVGIRQSNSTPPRLDEGRFLAVNHGYFNAIGNSANPVELLVVEAPELFSGSSRSLLAESTPSSGRNMMFVTHGTASEVHPGFPPPVDTIADLAYNAGLFAALYPAGANWDVVTLDWGPFSNTLPSATARLSPEICESLVYWLRETGYQYNQYHLLSHSSGSWGVDRMADLLASSGVSRSNINLTLFDTYAAPFRDSTPIGESAGYAEQYVDTGLDSPPGTHLVLPSMLNIDVTRLRSSVGVFDAHAWPYVWYKNTIADSVTALPRCNTLTSYWGFARSPLAQTVLADAGVTACVQNPDWRVLGSDPIILPNGTRRLPPQPNNWGTGTLRTWTPSTTGTVEVDAFGNVRLRTGSPVSVELRYDLAFASEFIRYSYRYTSPSNSGAAGYLTTSVDDRTFSEAFEQASGTISHFTGPLYLRGRLGPGPVRIQFLLHPGTGPQSSVEITDLEFGRSLCPADFDDGTNTGTPDGGVTIDDLLYYLGEYTQGTTRADLDDGTGTGIPDGGVTIDDLLYFLARYEAGC